MCARHVKPVEPYYDSPPTIAHLYISSPPFLRSDDTTNHFKTKQELVDWNDRELEAKEVFLNATEIPDNLVKCSKCGMTPSVRACTCCGLPYCSYYCVKEDWNVHSRLCSAVEYHVESEPKRNTVWDKTWGWM